MRAHGYDVVVAEHATGNDGIAAAAPASVAADLHALLSDDRVDAVVCAAGGHTSSLVLPFVDWDLVREAAKPIIGYSDATAVLWATLVHAGLITYHGPMAVSEWGEHGGVMPYTAEQFSTVVFGTPAGGVHEIEPPGRWTDEVLWWDTEDDRPRITHAGDWRCLVPGVAEGWLLPGCANTAGLLFGTGHLPDTEGAILCLDFFGSSPEKVWVQLGQWAEAGLLKGLAGAVIARHGCPRAAAAGSTDFDGVLLNVFGPLGIPVLVDVDFGHTEPRLTLPVGGPALLDAGHRSLVLW